MVLFMVFPHSAKIMIMKNKSLEGSLTIEWE